MTARAGTLLAASLLTVAAAGLASAAEPQSPMALTRDVLGRSNAIVKGEGDQAKLTALSDLLRGFLDTDAWRGSPQERTSMAEPGRRRRSS
jgi:hypothetical protein